MKKTSEKEFNLSEKIEGSSKEYFQEGWIKTKDIKEFVRLLKITGKHNYTLKKVSKELNRVIDKLAGDKLK